MKFSKQEIELLRKFYLPLSREELLLLFPGRKWHQLKIKASKLKIGKRLPINDRFWSKVNKYSGKFWNGSECWEWLASLDKNGYGKFSGLKSKRDMRAHRFAYIITIGELSDYLTIHHECLNKKCVNPSHLTPMTSADNNRQPDHPVGKNLRKTHCKYGHEFNEENTYIAKTGQRSCKICISIRSKKYNLQNKRPRIYKTHCPRGHEYTLENTYKSPDGGRRCRICELVRSRKRCNYKGGLPCKDRTHCLKGHEYTKSNTYYHNNHRYCKECHRLSDRRRWQKQKGNND